MPRRALLVALATLLALSVSPAGALPAPTQTTLAAAPESWTFLGPSFSDSLAGIVPSPHVGVDHTLFGYRSSQLFRSDDLGVAWTGVGAAPGDIEVLRVSPGYPSDRRMMAVVSGRVCRSDDGGASWRPAGSGITDAQVRDLVLSPNFAQDNNAWAAGSIGGVFRTDSAGETWWGHNSGISVKNMFGLAISPGYATDHTLFALAAFNATVYVYKTTGGAWSLSTSKAGVFWYGATGRPVMEISPSYPSDGTVFFRTEGGSSGLYRTTTAGTSWSRVMTSEAMWIVMSPQFASDGWALAEGRSNGEYTVLASHDHGATWQPLLPSTASQRGPWAIVGLPTGPALLQMDAEGWSFDRGVTWTPASPRIRFPATLQDVAVAPSFSQTRTLLADRGAISSPSAGGAWFDSLIEPPLSVWPVAFSPAFAADHTAFSAGGYRTTDGGRTWQSIADHSVIPCDVAVSPAFAEDHTVFLAGANIDVSTNGGTGWTHLKTDAYVSRIAISPAFATDGTLFAAGAAGNFKRSTDRGAHWTTLTAVPLLECTALAVSPAYATDHTVFAAFGNDGLHRSNDGGASWGWFWLGGDTPNGVLNNVVFSRDYATSGRMWASVEGEGIYVSENRAMTWTKVPGPYDRSVLGLAAPDSGPATLFVATRMGLWRLGTPVEQAYLPAVGNAPAP